MLIWSSADGAQGGAAARHDERIEERFTEGRAAERGARPSAETDDVLLLPRPVRETPLDLINDESWCAADQFIGTARPGRDAPDQPTRRRREAWVEASARRILIDRAYQGEIEWLADMGNDAARAALAARHRIDSKAG